MKYLLVVEVEGLLEVLDVTLVRESGRIKCLKVRSGLNHFNYLKRLASLISSFFSQEFPALFLPSARYLRSTSRISKSNYNSLLHQKGFIPSTSPALRSSFCTLRQRGRATVLRS